MSSFKPGDRVRIANPLIALQSRCSGIVTQVSGAIVMVKWDGAKREDPRRAETLEIDDRKAQPKREKPEQFSMADDLSDTPKQYSLF